MKVGTDIIKIDRIDTLIAKYGRKFKERFLTESEIASTQRTESLAGLWAAKEAVSKALGCGIGEALAFHDIIIEKDLRGAPHFRLSPEAQKRHAVKESSLSISHDGGFAIAIVALTQ